MTAKLTLTADQKFAFDHVRSQIGLKAANDGMKHFVMQAILDRVGLVGTSEVSRGFVRAMNMHWLADHEIAQVRSMSTWEYLKLVIICVDEIECSEAAMQITAAEWISNRFAQGE